MNKKKNIKKEILNQETKNMILGNILTNPKEIKQQISIKKNTHIYKTEKCFNEENADLQIQEKKEKYDKKIIELSNKLDVETKKFDDNHISKKEYYDRARKIYQEPKQKFSDELEISINKLELKKKDRELKILQAVEDGWTLHKNYKHGVKFSKPKSHDLAFEDKVWYMFALLGFALNKDRNFTLPFDKEENTQQIDVFAKSEAVAIYVECKSREISDKKNASRNYKETLEAWKSKKQGVETCIKKLYDKEQNLKCKFVFATKNVTIGDNGRKNLQSLSAKHLSESRVDYFIALHKQIGSAARYQFLSYVFSGHTVLGLDNRILAMEGKMGKYPFYTFNIEPEKLLRIAYVLHRNKANEDMMPTYQRLIKKGRLRDIQTFINDGGYFPNSLLISIDSYKGRNPKPLQFDPIKSEVASKNSKIGVLHLPNKFGSAYIIDGQHRLYGYSDSDASDTHTVPVVAFVNLEKKEQINLFLQINENQKPVPKSLRDTLNADILWTSSNFKNQVIALWSKISIGLGEDFDSPFYNYITTGEDKRVLTSRGSFFMGLTKGSRKLIGQVSVDKIEEIGVFYKGNLDDAYASLLPVLKKVFTYLQDMLPIEWDLKENSMLFINKGVAAIQIVLGDIYAHILKTENKSDHSKVSDDDLYKYLDYIISYIKSMDQETKSLWKAEKGDRGPIRYWRYFQKAIRDNDLAFNPPGLTTYLEEQALALDDEASSISKRIENILSEISKSLLASRFTDEWSWKKGVPIKVQEKAEELMRVKNRKKTAAEETNEWQNLNFAHYQKIANNNWQYNIEGSKTPIPLFKHFFTLEFEGHKKNISKDNALKWLAKAEQIRNKAQHNAEKVNQEELNFIMEVYESLQKNKEELLDFKVHELISEND